MKYDIEKIKEMGERAVMLDRSRRAGLLPQTVDYVPLIDGKPRLTRRGKELLAERMKILAERVP